MKHHDGWVLVNTCGKEPWMVTDYFHRSREAVIADFELLYGKGAWRRERRAGNFKMVKVRLVEIK